MISCEDSEFSVDTITHTTNTEPIIRPSDPMIELEQQSCSPNREMPELRNSHIASHDDHVISMDITDSGCLYSSGSMSISSKGNNSDHDDSSKHEELSPDDRFIKQFAQRCAQHPGRKPILMDIEKDLKPSQKAQLPFILVVISMKYYVESIL